jgi:hypothetical protein
MAPSAYAKSRGYDPSMGHNWKVKGKLIMVGDLVDVAETDRTLGKRRHPGEYSGVGSKRKDGSSRRKASGPTKGNVRPSDLPTIPITPLPPPDPTDITKLDLNNPDTLKALSYIEVRTLRELYAAKQAKLAFDQAVGQLADVTKVIALASASASAAARILERMPDRLAARIAAVTDERACREMIRQEVAIVCAEIARATAELPKQLVP